MKQFSILALAIAVVLALNSFASAQCGVRQQSSAVSSQDALGLLLQSGALNGASTSASSSVASAPQIDAASVAQLRALLAQQQARNAVVASSAPRLSVLNTGASSASASAVAGGSNVSAQDLVSLAALLDQTSPSVSASSASASNGCGGGGRFRPLANFGGGRRNVSRSVAVTRTFSR